MTLVKFNNRPVAKNFDSVFDDLFNGFPTLWNKNENGFSPAVNIHETKDSYHLELNAPGRNKEDFKIELDKGLLTISFETKDESKSDDYKTIRREFSYTSFKRSFSVDEKIDAENIQAKYENGILKVLLPKKDQPEAGSKQISIQ